jgi:hypothetical protein
MTLTIRTEKLVGTSMRLDWLEAIYKRWEKEGLPLDREGTKLLVGLSVSEFDALDLVWPFELLSAQTGFALVETLLPPSPVDSEITPTELGRLQSQASTSELRDLRNRFDAAHRALSRSGSNLGSIKSACAYKHYFNALIAYSMNHDKHRVAIHLAKAASAALAVKLGSDAIIRSGQIGNFWDDTLNTLSDDCTAAQARIDGLVEAQA